MIIYYHYNTKKTMKNKPLIYNSDIKALSKKSSITPDEMLLIPLHNALESKIQTYCHNLLNVLAFELEYKYKKKVAEFVQFDNGGKMGKKERIKKAKEGTKKGFLDSGIFMGTSCGQYNKVIFIEFKRISMPSKVIVEEKQQYYHDWLNSIGFEAHITNNPLYFREVILRSVKDFYSGAE